MASADREGSSLPTLPVMIRRRTAAETVSIVNTTPMVKTSTALAAGKSRKVRWETSSEPTPPAPIIPSTADARTFISNLNNQ